MLVCCWRIFFLRVWIPFNVVMTPSRNIFMASFYSHVTVVCHHCTWPVLYLSPACLDHSKCDNQEEVFHAKISGQWDVITSAEGLVFLMFSRHTPMKYDLEGIVGMTDICQDGAMLGMHTWAGKHTSRITLRSSYCITSQPGFCIKSHFGFIWKESIM